VTGPAAAAAGAGSGPAVAQAAHLLDGLARRDVPLAPLTTYRVGGAAALFVEARSVADLTATAAAVGRTGLPTLVVGKGSNLLVADAGFPGVAVLLGEEFATIDIDPPPDDDVSPPPPAPSSHRVRAGGAALLPVVARRTVKAGLTGFEWAVGVPGSIGGAVRMNAGGHGSDMAASLVDARVVDLATGRDERRPVGSLALGYRRSAIGPAHVVVDATLALAAAPGGDTSAGERTLSEIVSWRRAHQPGGPNAGSVFTNPPGDSAGRLIDEAGGKGLRVGTASVSTKHANFIQADPGGSADDVVALMGLVAQRVRERTGIDLHAETRLVGFPDPSPLPEVEG
jgi:UDP-N-acetylmuramate dehydrogenase